MVIYLIGVVACLTLTILSLYLDKENLKVGTLIAMTIFSVTSWVGALFMGMCILASNKLVDRFLDKDILRFKK